MAFHLDSGNTAWMLMSASLVLLMTPAVAFFYGGMVRGKSVLNMMMMSFGALGVVGLLWTLYGYSAAFGSNIAGGLIGNPFEFFGLTGLTDGKSLMATTGVPALVAVAFQATFAILTVALISGAIADRVRFGTWLVFIAIWVTVVYLPLAHMVWGGGLFSADGITKSIATPIDFAGGTVVHINAGVAGLALALVIGKRKGFGREPMRPHNLPFVMLGASLLWFGWFGFNAGSELAADGVAGRAWINSLVATSVAMLAWLATERIRDGHPTSLGAASGVVAGLVAITPAAAAVDTWGAIAIGAGAGVVCALAISLKYRFGFDDSLDVVGIHAVGGLLGTVAIGLFATDKNSAFLPAGAHRGLFYGGGFNQLIAQVIVAIAAIAFSFVLTYVIARVVKRFMAWRVTEDEEVSGIDLAAHGETAYETAAASAISERRAAPVSEVRASIKEVRA